MVEIFLLTKIINKSEEIISVINKQSNDLSKSFREVKDLADDFVTKHVNKELYSEFSGRFVKNAYDENLTEKDVTLDIDISVWLKKENKAFRIEKHDFVCDI